MNGDLEYALIITALTVAVFGIAGLGAVIQYLTGRRQRR